MPRLKLFHPPAPPGSLTLGGRDRWFNGGTFRLPRRQSVQQFPGFAYGQLFDFLNR
jgi:hypothetical protein